MPVFDHGAALLAPISIAIAIFAAATLLVIGGRAPRIALDVTALVATGTVIAILIDVMIASTSGHVVAWMAGWTPHHGYSVGIVIVADPVGSGIALLSACLTWLALFYSLRYIEPVHGHYHALMLLFLAGMVGLALTGDIFDMFCFFELMGAAAYGLTGMKVEETSSLQGALNFGIVNSLGAYATLMGIGMLYARAGTLGLAELGRSLANHPPDALIVAAFVLVLTGFLVKAALVPFHFWLADAHAVAPSPVCVLFSGVMVPLGIYSAFRIYWSVFAETIPTGDVRRTFIVLGVITAVVGAVMALSQRHVKRLLAYSTIAHVGLFFVALGCLTAAGTAGALLYVVGHAGVKSALFLMAGILLDLYGTVDEHELYGRARGQPLLGALFLIAGLALAALPPFGTALGKSISEEAAMRLGYVWAPGLYVAVSAMTGGAVLRVGARTFLALGPRPAAGDGSGVEAHRSTGSDAQPDVELRAIPWSMLVPVAVLLCGALVEGLIPGIREAAGRAGEIFIDHSAYVAQTLFRAPSHIVDRASASWTAAGVGLDVLSSVLAVGVAAGAIYGGSLLDRIPLVRRLTTPLDVLHKLHSGHVGDYVAWLVVGIVVLAGFVGIPVR